MRIRGHGARGSALSWRHAHMQCEGIRHRIRLKTAAVLHGDVGFACRGPLDLPGMRAALTRRPRGLAFEPIADDHTDGRTIVDERPTVSGGRVLREAKFEHLTDRQIDRLPGMVLIDDNHLRFLMLRGYTSFASNGGTMS